MLTPMTTSPDPFADDDFFGESSTKDFLGKPTTLRYSIPDNVNYADVFAWLTAMQVANKLDKTLKLSTWTDQDLQSWLSPKHWVTKRGSLTLSRKIERNSMYRSDYNIATQLIVSRNFVHPTNVCVLTQTYSLITGYHETFVTTKRAKHNGTVVISRNTEGRSRSTTCVSHPPVELSGLMKNYLWKRINYRTKIKASFLKLGYNSLLLEIANSIFNTKELSPLKETYFDKVINVLEDEETSITLFKQFCKSYLSMINNVWKNFPLHKIFTFFTNRRYWYKQSTSQSFVNDITAEISMYDRPEIVDLKQRMIGRNL